MFAVNRVGELNNVVWKLFGEHRFLGDDKGEALAHRSIGEVLLSLSEFEESLVHSRKYLSIARRLQDAAEEQRALYVLGQAYMDSGRINDSLKYFERSHNAVKAIPWSGEVGKAERGIMRARCLRNMASINWQLGRKEQFEELFERARVELCQIDTKDRFEDLWGLYDEAANITLVGDDLKTAKRYSDSSESSAKKVHGKRSRMCWFRSQVTKAKVALLQEQFEEAFSTLLSAYKQKVVSELDAVVENNVKMLAVVVKARDKMLQNPGRGFAYLEAIADALCNYSEAPEKKKVLKMAAKYYEKASERAKSEGVVEALPALNNSIAQTYMDCGDYPNAEAFFVKQLEYEESDPKAACQTYSNIASVRESLEKGFEVVLAVMQRWLQLAVKLNEEKNKEERIALQEILKLHDRFRRSSEADEYRERLEELGEHSEELPSSQGSAVMVDNFPDVDIEDLKLSDATSACTTSRPSRINSSLARKNEKGETPLHRAAQDETKVGELVSLLERGAPLEATDHAGWTPLADAAARDNLEAVKILLKFGADINHANDKGSTDHGATPFAQACNTGNLEVALCLLEKGAKVHLKSKNGASGLSHLRRLYAAEKDPLRLKTIEMLIGKVEATYGQLGLDLDITVAEGFEEDSPSLFDDAMSSPERGRKVARSPMRRMVSVSPLSSPGRTIHISPSSSPARSPSPCQFRPSPSPSLPSPGPGPQQYREAMAGLKGFSRRGSDQPLCSTQKRPLASRTNVPDDLADWLEDDTPAKKKRPSVEQIANTGRKSDENRPPCATTNPSPPPREAAHQRRQPFGMESIHAELAPPKPAVPEEKTMSKLNRKHTGFQPKINRIYTRAPSPVLLEPHSAPASSTSPASLPTTAATSSGTISRVRVRVQDQLLLVPLASPHLTIGNLAQEASRRYCRARGGAEPVLCLSTSDGALLDAGDFVSDVVDAHDPILIGKVESWITKTAEERYADFCSARSLTNFKNLHTKLSAIETSFEFRLESSPLRNQQSDAVLVALTSCPTLRCLTLNGCKLSDTCLPQLTTCISSLPSLTALDLSSNMFSMEMLNRLASLSIPTLRSLDFSRNMLGDRPVPDLTKAFPGLNKLSLKSCYLARPSIPGIEKLEYLDISLNQMTVTDLTNLISRLSRSEMLLLRGLTLPCDKLSKFVLASAWSKAFGEKAESQTDSNDTVVLALK